MNKKLIALIIIVMFLLTSFTVSANKIEISNNNLPDIYYKTKNKHFLFSKEIDFQELSTQPNEKSQFMPYLIKFDRQGNTIIGGAIEEVIVTGSGGVGFRTLNKKIIMKLDQQGNKIFKLVKEKSDYSYYLLSSINIDSQNNIIISTCGLKNQLSNKLDFFVSKYNSNGEFLWEEKYELKLSAPPTTAYMLIDIDSKDNIIFLVEANYFALNGQYKYYRVLGKIDETGNLVNEKTIKDDAMLGEGLWYPYDIAIDADDNVVLGSIEYIDEKEKIYTLKYNSDLDSISGFPVYYESSDGKEDYIMNLFIEVDKNNNMNDVIIACTFGTEIDGSYSKYTKIIKFDCDGNFLWNLINNKNRFNEIAELSVDSESNIVTNGYNGDSLAILLGVMSTIKYSKNGDLKWEKTYPERDGYNLALESSTNNIGIIGGIIAATTNGVTSKIYLNSTIIKYDPDGNVLWVVEDIPIKEGKEKPKVFNLLKSDFFTKFLNKKLLSIFISKIL